MSPDPPAERRDLGLLTGAVGLSALGDWLAIVPLALHVQERGGSGIAVAALFIALWSPAAVLAGPAGLLADGLSPARLLTACSLVARHCAAFSRSRMRSRRCSY